MRRSLKILILAAIASIGAVMLFKGVSLAGDRAWLSGHTYSKGIIINNAGSVPLSNYLLKITNPVYDEAGLAGSWHFDSVINNQTPDSSGNGKNATVYGYGATLSAGKFGRGMSFSGSGNYVDCGNIGSVKSVEFYIDDSSYAGGVLELNSAAYVSISGGKITATGFSSPVIYVNGAVDKSLSKGFNHIVVTTDTAIEASAVKIGVANSVYTTNGGIIDEARLYNRGLTSDEAAGRGKAKLNYGDIRFTDSDGTTPLNYWLEKDGTFWIKVPLIPKDSNKIIYVYYGNSNADSVSDTRLADEVSKRKPAVPEPTVNIYAEQGNL